MHDLDPAQFDLLVQVLSSPSSERDYKFLLSQANI